LGVMHLLATPSPWDSAGLWIVATGAAANMACATVGSLLVLRRMSMMGDAISHAVLPGLAAAFLWSGSYQPGPLLAGAAVAGLAAALLTQTLHQFVRVPADASMGIVFTTLFAVGVVLVRSMQGVHFDVQCVYEGALEFAPLSMVDLGWFHAPRALVSTTVALLANLAVLCGLWKEWKISSFDPQLATALGFSAARLHYLLMAMVAATAVACFEAVGSILVVAMFIVPASTAHLLTDRLAPMVLVACLLGAASAAGGYAVAHASENAGVSLSVAGLMTVVAGGLFAMAALFGPRYGVVVSVVHALRTHMRIAQEDLLALMYRAEELPAPRTLGVDEACRALGAGWLARRAVRRLVGAARIERAGDRLALTPAGRATARQLVRGHRLWEAYLVEHVGLAADHVHEGADRVEHFLDEQFQRRLEQRLDDVRRDPHGKPIP